MRKHPRALVETSLEGPNVSKASQLSLLQSCQRCCQLKWLSEFGVTKRTPNGRKVICKPCRNAEERAAAPGRALRAPRCSVEGCPKPQEKNTWCAMHNRRQYVHGDLDRGRIVKTEKRCNGCGVTKPVSEFYRCEAAQSWGFLCKPCSRAYTEARRLRRRDADLAQKRAYRLRRLDYWQAFDRARYWADPDKARKAKRDEYRRNPETHKEVNRRWKKENPQHHREMMRLNWQRRRAAKRAAQVAPVTRATWKAKVAYWGNLCWICRGPWTEMDHVKPVTKGGAHMLCNLRPVCRSCNAKKSNRWPLPVT